MVKQGMGLEASRFKRWKNETTGIRAAIEVTVFLLAAISVQNAQRGWSAITGCRIKLLKNDIGFTNERVVT
ncbi:hypothetical protein BMF38_13530 [Comamonas kerstersii]|nr:hypothetical protein BMF38_13530 [Comamonas kerstersii]